MQLNCKSFLNIRASWVEAANNAHTKIWAKNGKVPEFLAIVVYLDSVKNCFKLLGTLISFACHVRS